MKIFDFFGKTLAVAVLVTLSTFHTSSQAAALVDLRGRTPEAKSITISASKPANAGDAVITLATYDADFSNEGELVINGNQPVKLFGSAGVRGNDQNSANISFKTPASYWKNGNNTLVFKHLNTQGFIIDAATVAFAPAPGGSGTTSNNNTALPAFPVDLRGSTPEEASITISASKPANAGDAVITLATYDADFSNEGELVINGNQPVKLFGGAGVSGNDQNSANISFKTPASYWKNGNNTLVFRHLNTQGFIIDAATVAFAPAPGGSGTTSNNNTALPAFPVDLRGSTPEEASITISASKPANAGDAVITLATYDADFSNEGELVINGNQPVKLFGSAGVRGNDQNSANISLSTPASYWKNGNNTLVFRHLNTQGFTIEAATVAFARAPGGSGSTSNNNTAPQTAPQTQTGTGSASLNWTAPAARADGNALSLSEIAGYTVYYGNSAGNYPNSRSVNGSSSTSTTITNLPIGTYYMVVTTRDTGGRESVRSKMVTKLAK